MFIQPFKHWLDTIFCITQTLLMSFVSAFHLHHSLSSFPHNTTFHTICSSFFPLFLSPIYFLFFAFHYLSNWISLSVCPSPAFLFSFFFSFFKAFPSHLLLFLSLSHVFPFFLCLPLSSLLYYNSWFFPSDFPYFHPPFLSYFQNNSNFLITSSFLFPPPTSIISSLSLSYT